jgi:hypothetical protein
MDSPFWWAVLILTMVVALAIGAGSVLVMLNVNRHARQRSHRYRSIALAKPGPASAGEHGIRCPRCHATGHVPAAKAAFECWECHLFVDGDEQT